MHPRSSIQAREAPEALAPQRSTRRRSRRRSPLLSVLILGGATALLFFLPSPAGAQPVFEPDDEYRRVTGALSLLMQRSWVEAGNCTPSFAGCISLKESRSSSRYTARVLSRGPVAVLPIELSVAGVPYRAWAPASAVVNASSEVERWTGLAESMAPLACEGRSCRVLTYSPFQGDAAPDRSLWLCSTTLVGSEPSPPHGPCEPLLLLEGERSWIRAVYGWGDELVARQLGFEQLGFEPGDVTLEYHVIHPPDVDVEDLLRVIEPGFRAPPLHLTTAFVPAAAPRELDAVRRYEPSSVLPSFREWTRVLVSGQPAGGGSAAGATALLVRTFLYVGKVATGNLKDYRPAEGQLIEEYVARLRERIDVALEGFCGGRPQAGRIECRP